MMDKRATKGERSDGKKNAGRLSAKKEAHLAVRPPRSKARLTHTTEQTYALPALQRGKNGQIQTIRYRKGAAPKFDYNSLEFYHEILRLAAGGLTNAQIAAGLSEKFGESLSPQTFYSMKNGNYEGWSKEENKIRGEYISECLARGRTDFVNVMKSKYVSLALGTTKTKNVTTVKKKLVVNGEPTEDEVVQTTEVVVEYPPSLQALSKLLSHYDRDWFNKERGEEPDDDTQKSDEFKGVDPASWVDLMIRGRADEITKRNV